MGEIALRLAPTYDHLDWLIPWSPPRGDPVNPLTADPLTCDQEYQGMLPAGNFNVGKIVAAHWATFERGLPQIPAVDFESVEKSSLIENISSITVLRDSGTLTRTLIECHMRSSSSPGRAVVIIRRIVDSKGEDLIRPTFTPFGAPIEDRAGVEIMGQGVDDFAFVNLPGVIASVGPDGHESDIASVEELVHRTDTQSRSRASHATISQIGEESELEDNFNVQAPVDRNAVRAHHGRESNLNDKSLDEGLPVLSHVNPRRGPTSGGEDIYLIVRNLQPDTVLYARFGSNVAPTSHIADGVLACRLPAATNPGIVDITLCQAPSVHEKGYGDSLISFEYEANTVKAVALLPKLLGEKLFTDLPVTPGSLGNTTRGPATGPVQLSSLPQSAFLEILAAFKSLPDFEQRLSTVNEYQQSLLHLAVHLRYRELVQRLMDWGIDLNIKDVNGFTALHAAYLCGDAQITHMLEQRGSTQLSLDELGRPPVELASWFTKTPKEPH